MHTSNNPRIIVGITGASGIVYGVRALELLRDLNVETHLILSPAAEVTLAHESDMKVADVKSLADVVHRHHDLAAAPSSGSFQTMGMLVAPCSVRSLSEIASGLASNLLTRAADVTLKERRPAGADGTRDAISSGTLARHDCGDGNGRHRRAPLACILQPAG